MILTGYLRLVCIWTIALLAASANLSAQRQLFRQYGSADGLGNLNVRCLFQDHTGFLWVGTDNGLFRYDGGSFRAFGHAEGLPDTEIVSLAESPDGSLWVGTNNGIARMSGNRFELVDVGAKGLFRAVAFDQSGKMYLEDESAIIRGVPDGNGSYKFRTVVHGATQSLFVSGNDIQFGKDGTVWRLRGDREERLAASAGLPVDYWGAIVEDSLGDEWVRSRTRLYELPHGQTTFLDRSTGIPHATESYLYADRHGSVFVPSIAGTVVLDGVHRSFIDSRHGLSEEPSGPTLTARDESLWVATAGGGLLRRLGHGEWLSWNKHDGLLDNTVWAIRTDRVGKVWLGTGGGLTILNSQGAVVRSWTMQNGLSGDRALSIAEGPAGDFFVGTDPSGVSHFDERGNLLQTYGSGSGLGAIAVQSMAVDLQGRLWVVGNGGFYRSRESTGSTATLTFARIDIPSPVATSFRSMVIDKDGTVWIASSRGLARFDGRHWRVFNESDGLESSDVAVVALSQGSLWVGYRDALGITRLDFNGDLVHAAHVTTKDGLSSDEILALAFDHQGQLWVNTDRGVDVYRQGLWRHYGSEDGLIWDDTDTLALDIDSVGNVWVGTSAGVSRYAPLPYPLADHIPPVVITAIEGQSQDWQASARPVLSYAHRSLSIQYAALSYAAESDTRFRYRLLGYDTAWYQTRERSVHFAGLPTGDYQFEVSAAGPDGAWNPVPAQVSFSIKPPWWRSWWFVSSCLLLAGLLGSTVWQFRVRALILQKRLLEERVAQRTAELIESHRQLEQIAYFDMLTSLPNRRRFVEEFRRRLALGRRDSQPFALLLIDLDFFKQINDSFGHDAGDAVLVEAARRLTSVLRESDCVARLGGDEFAILLFTAPDPAAVEFVYRRILANMSVGIPFQETHLHIGCSVGIARFPSDGETQESLYKSADVALYEAKRSSRNVDFPAATARLRAVPEKQCDFL
jgi:diguanylate cyclase (GGDEF)-like protein